MEPRESKSLKLQLKQLQDKQGLENLAYRAIVEERDELRSKVHDLEDQLSTYRTSRKETVTLEDVLTSSSTQQKFKDSISLRTTESDNKVLKLARMFLGIFGREHEREKSDYVQPSGWEYVIVLPNPDNCEIEQRGVSEKEAEVTYKKCFNGEEAEAPHIQNNNLNTEIDAFKHAWRELRVYTENSKLFKGGGRLTTNGDRGTYDNMTVAGDFLSLIRNVMLLKLTYHVGTTVRQALSGNGKFIYILIRADDDALANEAERTEFNMQLEVGMSDLASLEPCDEKLRPYSVLQKPAQVYVLEKEIRNKHKEIFQLSTDVDLDNSEQETESISYISESTTIEQWHSYLQFLRKLNVGLNLLERAELNEHYRFLCYHKLIRKIINTVNSGQPKQFRLKTLWDRLEIKKPFGAWVDYVRQFNESGEDELDKYFRTHRNSDLGKRSIFKNSDRLKLLYSMIHRQIAVHELVELGYVVAHFPLHNYWEHVGKSKYKRAGVGDELYIDIERLLAGYASEPRHIGVVTKWNQTSFWSSRVPDNYIRKYYGEKIALYFAFLSMYCNSMKIPGYIGLVVYIVQRTCPSDATITQIFNGFYCIFMSGWATVFLELWRRKESSLGVRWGQTDFEEDEVPRPQFRGEYRRSPIDDNLEEEWYDPQKRKKYFLVGIMISSMIIFLVLAFLGSIIVLRGMTTDILHYGGFDFSGPVLSIANAVQIQIFNFIYSKLAVKLTDLENHRTQSEYESSLILKTYGFQFVNSFNTLFYIAFVKTHYEGCYTDTQDTKSLTIGASCLNELHMQLVSLFLVNFFKNILEIGQPILEHLLKKRKLNEDSESRKRRLMSFGISDLDNLRDDIDNQLSLPAYMARDVDGTMDDYMELAVLFGYIILFAVAFPLATSVAWFSLLLEIKVDKLKILLLVRRPQPMGAKSIGIWWSIFQTTCIISIFTNCAVLCFTAQTFKDWDFAQTNIFIAFGLSVVFLLMFRGWVRTVIPDMPEKYELILKRHQLIVEKCLKGQPESRTKLSEETKKINPRIHCTNINSSTIPDSFSDITYLAELQDVH
jgi:hypothetical protein